MKRIWPVFLALALAISLAACNSERTASSNAPAPSPSSAADQTGGSESSPAEGTGSGILIAYFTMPEDVDTSGVDAIAGASIVVRGGQVMGNVEYMAAIIQETVGGDLFRIETVQPYPLDHDPLVDQAAEE